MFAFVAACCYAFLIFHLIFTAAIGNGQQAATFVTDKQRHWTTSATSSTNIRQVLVVASANTQPKDQRVDRLHFVSANDRRPISTKSYPFGRDLNSCSWRPPFRSFRRLSRREWPTRFLAWLETRVFRERNLSKYRASFFRSIGPT